MRKPQAVLDLGGLTLEQALAKLEAMGAPAEAAETVKKAHADLANRAPVAKVVRINGIAFWRDVVYPRSARVQFARDMTAYADVVEDDGTVTRYVADHSLPVEEG